MGKIMEIRNLIEEREKLYGKIKKELTPLILKLTEDSEKVRGYINYWELFNELKNYFRLTVNDYQRLIEDLKEERYIKIKKGWSVGVDDFITTKK